MLSLTPAYETAQGLSTLREGDAFNATAPTNIIVNALLIACQAARTSEVHYKALHSENLYLVVWHLMGHGEGSVRAKACNLVGNLCRHSAFFYKTLVTALVPGATPPPTLLTRLIQLCKDVDAATRKFACFAIGNAAFHSAVLYPYLVDAIPLLVSALHDVDEKTRANAAGALGNLVRNSSELCALLVKYEVAWHLLELARNDTSNAPRRIALFSLGTLSVYEQCRGSIMQLEPPLELTLAEIEGASEGADQQVSSCDYHFSVFILLSFPFLRILLLQLHTRDFRCLTTLPAFAKNLCSPEFNEIFVETKRRFGCP